MSAGLALRLACLGVEAAAPSGAIASASGLSLRWVSAASGQDRAYVEVSGLGAGALKQLRRANLNLEQWQRLLAVHAEQGDLLADIGSPPMLGTYRVTEDSIRFEPQFPLEAGIVYRATLQPRQVPGARNSGAQPLSAAFQLPAQKPGAPTVVTCIYPSGGIVPENLLKFYVHFSAAMSRGHIYDHIHLLDETGQAVELPFLEIDEELWNPDMTRLTLFIDPGRIKRGVKPLEEIGPALSEGKRYTLVIDSAWKDGAGSPLKESFHKLFQVGPTDREPPDPSRWKILPPANGTRDELAVTFPEPMDHALAQRMIRVSATSGLRVPGRATLGDEERRWAFLPVEAWRKGAYQLTVQTTIEDLAGNNIGKAFEVDVFDGIQRRLTNSTVTIPFEIR
jgi:hypothetical protein